MITLDLGTVEYYDSDTSQFRYESGGIVRFEYSLKALYEWECKWRKPFLKGELTEEELIDFYIFMALDPIDKKFIDRNVAEILSNYIKDPQTATTFGNNQSNKQTQGDNNKKVYTAEELYALMFSGNVPLIFEERNLNHLLVILRVIGNYNNPPKKMSKQEVLKQNADLNAKRKAQMKSRG